MVAPSDPNLIIGGLALGGLLLVILWRVVVWIRDAPATPDPWDAETDQKLSEPDAVEVCPHCLTEQPPAAWFCKGCGRAVGPYNNMMPYIQIFSEGEVFRSATCDRLRRSPLIVIGFFLLSLNFLTLVFVRPYGSWFWSLMILLALLSYWSSFLKNLKRSKAEETKNPDEDA
ncbi:MAG TPA: hypothetical protein VFY06_02325 [Verrucomicrobiae bacterium]|nr:hypothetical protein [Verrucomicrobiae bacterium]